MVWKFKSLVFKGRCLKQDKANFNPPNIINFSIVYEFDICLEDLNANSTLKDCLFGSIKLTKNADPDKYSHSGMVVDLSLVHFFQIHVFIGVRMLLFSEWTIVHQCDKIKKKDILVFGEGPT